jgi:predicted nuclease of predicted toxin-antitoxin system
LKLLVDENLPLRLIADLDDLFPESIHVRSAGLGGVADTLIWEHAKQRDLTVLTKDRDFANLSIVRGAPPKVILLQTGNCSTTDIIRIMRNNAIRLSEFHRETKRSLLILK